MFAGVALANVELCAGAGEEPAPMVTGTQQLDQAGSPHA